MHFHPIFLLTASVLTQTTSASTIPDVSLFKRVDDCHDATGQTSQWANKDNDGNGHFIGSCGKHGHNDDKCWTDTYVVQSQVRWTNWRDASAGLDCKRATTCTITQLNSLQQCQEWSTAIELNAGFAAEGVSIGASISHTTGDPKCDTSSSSFSCAWTKYDQCHKVVASSQVLVTSGYVRRTCKRPRGAEGSGGVKRPDGDYTIGWADWETTVPTGQWKYSCHYHCDTNPGHRNLPDDGPINKA